MICHMWHNMSHLPPAFVEIRQIGKEIVLKDVWDADDQLIIHVASTKNAMGILTAATEPARQFRYGDATLMHDRTDLFTEAKGRINPFLMSDVPHHIPTFHQEWKKRSKGAETKIRFKGGNSKVFQRNLYYIWYIITQAKHGQDLPDKV